MMGQLDKIGKDALRILSDVEAGVSISINFLYSRRTNTNLSVLRRYIKGVYRSAEESSLFLRYIYIFFSFGSWWIIFFFTIYSISLYR